MPRRNRAVETGPQKRQRQSREQAALARELKKARCMVCGKPVAATDRVQDGWMHLDCQYNTSTR